MSLRIGECNLCLEKKFPFIVWEFYKDLVQILNKTILKERADAARSLLVSDKIKVNMKNLGTNF